MDNIGLRKMYSSIKIDNVTVIKLKALARQRAIKGYYKLRKAKLIQKLEANPDVNGQFLIPGLEVPWNTTRSVNTSTILDDPILADPILDDNAPVLQPTSKFVAGSMQEIKDFGNWLLDYKQPKPKVIDEALESFMNQIKKWTTRKILQSNWEVKICVEKVYNTASNRWKSWVWFWFISGYRQAAYYKASDHQRSN